MAFMDAKSLASLKLRPIKKIFKKISNLVKEQEFF
jgi:hypothetical protein